MLETNLLRQRSGERIRQEPLDQGKALPRDPSSAARSCEKAGGSVEIFTVIEHEG
jgi:hypothetical protein